MVNWNAVFKALEKWRDDVSVKDPSVTTVAEKYKKKPWAVLVSTILSLRTKDDVTLAASEKILKAAINPSQLNSMKEEEIAKLIYPVGFYHNKASSLKKIAAILLAQYKGKVPSTMEELLALPGVGRKTANLVLSEAFDIDALCVDIHVHRISNRCGWLISKTPEETEMTLREILPHKYWKRINYLLVLYGQKLCRPVSPFCSCCVIRKQCMRNGVERSR
ncbi:MAG: endonuclease III [Treponema sp.]|nr:endonuclease III [Treponema sp.]MCL2238235.1 endonuclease III [Treponema sp.]